jgi:hypothetical protein
MNREQGKMNFRLRVAELDGVSALKRTAVKEAFDRLFAVKNCCNTEGCDRRPMNDSRFCGCCLENQKAGQQPVFRGGALLPESDEMARLAFDSAMGHEWHRPPR